MNKNIEIEKRINGDMLITEWKQNIAYSIVIPCEYTSRFVQQVHDTNLNIKKRSVLTVKE
jgi:hypothetical protein